MFCVFSRLKLKHFQESPSGSPQANLFQDPHQLERPELKIDPETLLIYNSRIRSRILEQHHCSIDGHTNCFVCAFDIHHPLDDVAIDMWVQACVRSIAVLSPTSYAIYVHRPSRMLFKLIYTIRPPVLLFRPHVNVSLNRTPKLSRFNLDEVEALNCSRKSHCGLLNVAGQIPTSGSRTC